MGPTKFDESWRVLHNFPHLLHKLVTTRLHHELHTEPSQAFLGLDVEVLETERVQDRVPAPELQADEAGGGGEVVQHPGVGVTLVHQLRQAGERSGTEVRHLQKHVITLYQTLNAMSIQLLSNYYL